MSDIPPGVISDILCRLPVESLLSFRCVCKLWLALIDSPHFVKMHLNHSIKLKSSNVNNKLILRGGSSLYSISSGSFNTRITNPVIDARLAELNHPLIDSATLVLGNYNGLMLLTSKDVEDCGLWNPSTHKFQKLPYQKFNLPKAQTMVQYHAGLGYDQNSNDYKVVRIMQACNMNNEEVYAEAMILSLESGSWKQIKGFPYWICQDVGGIFALGALHWMTTTADELEDMEDIQMIVALDLGTEEYELVPLPLHLNVASRVDIGVLEGFLCLSCNYNMDHVDIWLMRDHGKAESWSKLLSVAQVDVNWSWVNVKPITYSASGKQVLLEKDSEQLLWYDLEKKSAKKIQMLNGPRIFDAILYLESLAQLNGGGDDGVVRKTGYPEDKRRQNKKRGFSIEGLQVETLRTRSGSSEENAFGL